MQDTVVNLAQAARALGVASQTIVYWAVHCGCPYLRGAAGKGNPWLLDLSAVSQWRQRYLAQRNGETVAQTVSDPEQQARLRTVINDLETRLQSARAELVAFESALPDHVIRGAHVATVAQELMRRRAELEVLRLSVRTARMRFGAFTVNQLANREVRANE